MPPTTRKQGWRRSLTVQTNALSIQGRGSTAGTSSTSTNEFYNSDEDYDSDADAELSLADRASSKLRSLLHNSWVDLEDEEENYPHDKNHDLATVEPKLDDLAEFLVGVEESLVWWKESAIARSTLSDVDAWCNMFREVKKDGRSIGTRLLLELKMVIDTWVRLYRGLEEHRPALEQSLLVRRVRTKSTHERTESVVHTTGEALVQRMEALKQKMDEALNKCGESV